MKYFTISELTKSSTAERLGISNDPSPEAVKALTELAENVLDPLRRAYGRPIIVNSGYRCQALNTAVGGAKKSQHLKGEAADISGGSKAENKKLFEIAKQMDLPFDQLIDEKNFSWIHISYTSTGEVRHKILHL